MFNFICMCFNFKWAATWQNQQYECAPSEDSAISLGIRPVWSVFAVRMKKDWVLSYPLSGQRRLWSNWADAQADPSLCWAHSHFVGFVMSQLKFSKQAFSNVLYRKPFYFCKLFEPRHDKTWLQEFPTRRDANQPAQPQKLARVFKFRLQNLEIL